MSIIGAVTLSSLLAGAALIKEALTLKATALAWLMSIGICFIGGLPAFFILLSCFAFTVAADKFAGAKADVYGLRRKSGKRDSVRLLCNVGVGTTMLLIYGTTDEKAFLLAYAAAMGESLSDSLASKLGPLTRGKTVDICTFRHIKIGLSGGVSALGTAASFVGAAIVGGLSILFSNVNLKEAAFITALAFVGSLTDSVLGSLAQVKYLCPVCFALTERREHCGTEGLLYKGLRCVNNDTVNFLSNLFTAILALFVSQWI